MKEILKDVFGYEELYSVSNFGRVYSKSRRRFLKQEFTKGYKRVSLSKDGIVRRYQVHRLVASHFLDNPYEKQQVHHIDHDGCNNCVSNLEWVSVFENERYNHLDGTRSVSGFKLTKEQVLSLRQMKYDGVKNSELSKIFKINERNVRRIIARDTYKEY